TASSSAQHRSQKSTSKARTDCQACLRTSVSYVSGLYNKAEDDGGWGARLAKLAGADGILPPVMLGKLDFKLTRDARLAVDHPPANQLRLP
ncbi:hypothetical protein, partial [Rhizobium leguminosarum]|uniref:hypothetical protein n=1 Tax=Rhizobium leguminosarum TaxID=384 RepID=UPI001C97F1E7